MFSNSIPQSQNHTDLSQRNVVITLLENGGISEINIQLLLHRSNDVCRTHLAWIFCDVSEVPKGHGYAKVLHMLAINDKYNGARRCNLLEGKQADDKCSRYCALHSDLFRLKM